MEKSLKTLQTSFSVLSELDTDPSREDKERQEQMKVISQNVNTVKENIQKYFDRKAKQKFDVTNEDAFEKNKQIDAKGAKRIITLHKLLKTLNIVEQTLTDRKQRIEERAKPLKGTPTLNEAIKMRIDLCASVTLLTAFWRTSICFVSISSSFGIILRLS